jgi:diphthine-ammonia ligase
MSYERSSRPQSRVAVLYSGGKDSNYALYEASKKGFEVVCLLTLRPVDVESMLFHYPNASWTGLQAEALGIPLLAREVNPKDELRSLSELVAEAKVAHEIEGVVTGAVKSHYQLAKFGRVFEENGLDGINPLWNVDEEQYLRKLVADGFRAILTRVAALGLGSEWLGAELDSRRVERLISLARKERFNPSLEGGEGETFVLDQPLFRKEIVVLEADKAWTRDEGTLSIKKAILRNKPADV